MIRTLGSIVLFLLSSLLCAGSVEAFVDNDEVFSGDSVILTISVVGEDIKSLPNIPSIGGAKVVNSSRRHGSSFTSVNGKSKMEVTESLMLEFRVDHNMTVPSFAVEVDGKMESSQPIAITVTSEKRNVVSDSDLALDMELSKKEAFLGEPIVATVRFKQKKSVNVLDIEYQEPKFEGFFSRKIGKQRNYNKGNYIYMELRYLLIAKQDGTITVEPARAKIAQSSGRRQFGGWFSDVPKWSRLISASYEVEILKPNSEYDIIGDYRLEENIDTQKVEVNKPINLKIELNGEGSLDDFEGIKFDIDGVTIYSDDAKLKSKLVGDRLESHFIKGFVFIADHDFVIPSKTIRVYNYKTSRVTILKTKEYHIKVTGSSKRSTSSAVYTKNLLEDKPKEEIVRSISWEVPSWFILLGAFVFGIVVTVVGQRYLPSFSFRKLSLKSFSMSSKEALETLYPHISKSREVEEMVRKLYDKKQGKKVEIDKELLKRLVEKYKIKESKS